MREFTPGNYDPFTYQPMLRYFYEGGPVPQAVSAIAAEFPEAAAQVRSVWQFSEWMKTYLPDAYAIVSGRRPDLLDPGSVIASGSITPAPGAIAPGLAGLGQTAPDTPVTDWGKQLLDLAKTYLQVDTQRDLLKANIALAEKGLPPINAGSIAPQVNVGLSGDVQKIAMLGLGGLVVVGIVSALRRR
jgi:hypothetical protein